jgi:hypothetical protein
MNFFNSLPQIVHDYNKLKIEESNFIEKYNELLNKNTRKFDTIIRDLSNNQNRPNMPNLRQINTPDLFNLDYNKERKRQRIIQQFKEKNITGEPYKIKKRYYIYENPNFEGDSITKLNSKDTDSFKNFLNNIDITHENAKNLFFKLIISGTLKKKLELLKKIYRDMRKKNDDKQVTRIKRDYNTIQTFDNNSNSCFLHTAIQILFRMKDMRDLIFNFNDNSLEYNQTNSVDENKYYIFTQDLEEYPEEGSIEKEIKNFNDKYNRKGAGGLVAPITTEAIIDTITEAGPAAAEGTAATADPGPASDAPAGPAAADAAATAAASGTEGEAAAASGEIESDEEKEKKRKEKEKEKEKKELDIRFNDEIIKPSNNYFKAIMKEFYFAYFNENKTHRNTQLNYLRHALMIRSSISLEIVRIDNIIPNITQGCSNEVILNIFSYYTNIGNNVTIKCINDNKKLLTNEEILNDGRVKKQPLKFILSKKNMYNYSIPIPKEYQTDDNSVADLYYRLNDTGIKRANDEYKNQDISGDRRFFDSSKNPTGLLLSSDFEFNYDFNKEDILDKDKQYFETNKEDKSLKLYLDRKGSYYPQTEDKKLNLNEIKLTEFEDEGGVKSQIYNQNKINNKILKIFKRLPDSQKQKQITDCTVDSAFFRLDNNLEENNVFDFTNYYFIKTRNTLKDSKDNYTYDFLTNNRIIDGFNLIGIILKSGTQHGGHWYSYIKLNNKWYIVNDIGSTNNYKEITEENLRSYDLNNTKLLIFERISINDRVGASRQQQIITREPIPRLTSERIGEIRELLHEISEENEDGNSLLFTFDDNLSNLNGLNSIIDHIYRRVQERKEYLAGRSPFTLFGRGRKKSKSQKSKTKKKSKSKSKSKSKTRKRK